MSQAMKTLDANDEEAAELNGYEEAIKFCKKRNMTLATIKDKETNDYLSRLIIESDKKDDAQRNYRTKFSKLSGKIRALFIS